ncbi:DUF3558 domain-containing protein [Streptomyces sp. NPDC003717]|uniref:DUF3558 domain-containing protein n=1 Tax=Streptomyces sp. NPDC003717 TaxID=3154276 RepID=UPI0033B6053D
MQRKVYVPGAAALLAVLLAGCTGGSDEGGGPDDGKPGEPGTTAQAAQPGRYRTIPEPCRAVDRKTLDALLPGIENITDEEQRTKAYAGEPTLTYDTDRKVGCRWKVDAPDATDHLFVDFERVVSYDGAVSDDNQAQQLFGKRIDAAHLPEPAVTESDSDSDSGSDSPSPSGTPAPSGTPSGAPSGGKGPGAPSLPPSSPAGSPSDSADSADPAAELQPRLLDDLGDEAFLDDRTTGAGSNGQGRTVTVAFRTSNVMVTVEYAEQSATLGVVPDSEEMQDRARELASRLDDSLSG